MLRILCIGAAIITWFLIPFGAYVRLKNAGLSCPDWPLCYGQLFPPGGFEIALEVSHRFTALFLGILIIVITFVTFWEPSNYKFRKLAVASLIIVIIQGILGALTVTMVLWPPVVTLHLLGGNILFGIMVYLTRITFNMSNVKYKAAEDVAVSSTETKNIGQSPLIFMLAVLFIMIISGGYNIYPKEIEVLLDELDGVLESALIGIPHPDFGEGVVAVIVPQPGAKIIQEDIMLKLKDQIARFKHPKRVVFIDELPRNTMGKVQKNDLRERFARLF